MEIITYPHPTLRRCSKPLKRFDAQLHDIVRQMFELMYEAKGVGLAANQVNLPLRMFIVNLEADPDKGEELTFINPVFSLPKGAEEAEEGCLSLPGLYGHVRRPAQIRISAYNLQGEEVSATLDGLFSRVFQHELDHLDGVLFVDRLSETAKVQTREALEEFESKFAMRREAGEIPVDKQIAQQWAEWEQRYC